MAMTPRRRSAHRGFTLVELMIAATMMAVLMVGLGTHLRGAVTVWRRTRAAVDRLQRERVAMERLSQDLANAFVYDGSERAPIHHEFSGQAARWCTLVSATDARSGPSTAARWVAYRCATGEEPQGLLRTEQSASQARDGTAEVSPHALVPDCAGLAFRYGYLPAEGQEGLVWEGLWPYEKELPRLIEVTLTRADGRRLRVLLAPPSGSLCRSGSTPLCKAS